MHRVAITGIGVTSAIGLDTTSNLEALKSGSSGVSEINYLKTRLRDSHLAAEVKANNRELAELCGLSYSKNYSRTILLGLIAAKEAISHAGLDKKNLGETHFFNGTTVGGMDNTELHYQRYIENGSIDDKNIFSYHDCGAVTEKIADIIGIRKGVSTISTACSSSANAIMLAGRKIKAGKANYVVAGGTDALSIFTLNGFNSLQILDKEKCKPFDKDRKGLNLGEGAGYLVLENETHAKERGAEILAYLSGFGNANDAFHQTASSAEGIGAGLAMEKAIKSAGISSNQIDYVNVHGTGTLNNDLSEGLALIKIFNKNVPPFSSTKPFTGHTLGAAGGIEAVFSVLSILHNMLFTNLNYKNAIEELELQPVIKTQTSASINRVISNSFGFGGNCTSLIFEK